MPEFEDLTIGEGAVAERGTDVDVVYTLALNRGDIVQAEQSCAFRIGRREVIAGLEYGVEGMRAGGERRIRVGPHLGYRDHQVPGLPPNALLEFRVKLVKVTAQEQGSDIRRPAEQLDGMSLDSATAEDCRAIAEVHVESWQRAYEGFLPKQFLASLSVAEREAMWQRMVEREPSHLVLARSVDQVIGFVAFGASRDEGAPADRAEIWAIYVKPACWSTGAGRLLWLEALQRILAEGYKSISLWVIDGNERAARFYERAGFALEPGVRRSFEIGGTTLAELRYVRPSA